LIITSKTRFPLNDNWPSWISLLSVFTRSRELSQSLRPPAITQEKVNKPWKCGQRRQRTNYNDLEHGRYIKIPSYFPGIRSKLFTPKTSTVFTQLWLDLKWKGPKLEHKNKNLNSQQAIIFISIKPQKQIIVAKYQNTLSKVRPPCKLTGSATYLSDWTSW